MKDITIVIPVYNDKESLAELESRLKQLSLENVRFLIVDNGSTIPLNITNNSSNSITFTRSNVNLGFGGGIMFGVKQCDTEFVGWMPGNLKISPSDLPDFFTKFQLTPNTFVKAKRIGRPKIDLLKTRIAGVIQSLVLLRNMNDSGGTPTICRKDFISQLDNWPKDYVFESYVLFMAKERKLEIVRPPIHYGSRKFGNSHWQSGFKAEIRLMLSIIQQSRFWK